MGPITPRKDSPTFNLVGSLSMVAVFAALLMRSPFLMAIAAIVIVVLLLKG